MDVASHQRKLLHLLRATYVAPDIEDPYISRVAASRDLQEARHNIRMWRYWVFDRSCPLTLRLLRQRENLQVLLAEFTRMHNLSPFRETQPVAFLDWLSHHPDSLVMSVASFELALFQLKLGSRELQIVRWTVEPSSVLHKLALDLQVDRHNLQPGNYEIWVSPEYDHGFEIHALSDVAANNA